MPLPCAMRATFEAMPPKPSSLMVFPVSCTPSLRIHSPVADAAIHQRDAARGGPHQRDRVLGDRGVAIALDGVDLHPERFELLGFM